MTCPQPTFRRRGGAGFTIRSGENLKAESRFLLPHPKFLLLALVLVTAVLGLLGFAVQWTRDFDPRPRLPLLLRAFDVNREANVPTWFSGSLFLLVSLMARGIAVAEHNRAGAFVVHWNALAWISVFLSLDEVSALHELGVEPIRSALGLGPGPFYFAWVVPGILFAAAVFAAYWRFARALPPRVRKPFEAGAILFFGGALGLEMANGWYRSRVGWDATYVVLFTLEESLEMLGASSIVYSLAVYLKYELRSPALRLF